MASFNTLFGDEYKRKVVGKWYESGFLDGLEDTTIKENMAQLLESPQRQPLNEVDRQESSGFESVQFPIVRRVYAKLVSSDLIPFPTNMTPDFWEKTDFKPNNKIKKHKL
jgi:hypothetical protein